MNILFVCSSNICRSPFCEYVFRDMVAKDPELQKRVSKVASAAVFNRMYKIHPKARIALLREGFDGAYIDAHKPSFKWSDPERFEQADVIIGMSKMHRWLTPCRWRKKFVTLSEAAEGKYTPLPDPFLYKTQEEYDKVMSVIKIYVEKYAAKLEKELAAKAGKQPE